VTPSGTAPVIAPALACRLLRLTGSLAGMTKSVTWRKRFRAEFDLPAHVAPVPALAAVETAPASLSAEINGMTLSPHATAPAGATEIELPRGGRSLSQAASSWLRIPDAPAASGRTQADHDPEVAAAPTPKQRRD
jgi:hypothetical protein